jgi:group I intron endonuclease
VEKVSGIYIIVSPTNKVYVGQSLDLRTRIESYKRLWQKSDRPVIKSIIKHGIENHTIEEIEYCDQELLNEREIYWEQYYRSLGFRMLNASPCGNSHFNRSNSEETRQKLRLSKLGERNHFYKKEFSEDHRNKISKALKGRVVTQDTKEKIGASNKGKKRTVEAIELNRKLRSGEKSCTAKLTALQVRVIMHCFGFIPHKELAKIFNVKPTAISGISAGRKWNSVTGFPRRRHDANAPKSAHSRCVGGYKKGKPAEQHPMYGKKRPDVVERNKLRGQRIRELKALAIN